ncbi:CD247 antigen like [Misgurnus anguillicaudatus]|uniref:CD247 antigen like n=1 Tax=Misgurnus anguillicaudatus TaxID=75329 RepID=UPI003CCF7F43
MRGQKIQAETSASASHSLEETQDKGHFLLRLPQLSSQNRKAKKPFVHHLSGQATARNIIHITTLVSRNVMEIRRKATILFLATHVSSADASASLYNPVYCYALDVFLLLYSIIFTALFFREKFTKTRPDASDAAAPAVPARNPNEPVYTDLDLPQIGSDYQQLDRPIRRREEETQYQELRGQSNDEYQKINTKARKPKSKSNEARTGRRREGAENMEMYALPQ